MSMDVQDQKTRGTTPRSPDSVPRARRRGTCLRLWILLTLCFILVSAFLAALQEGENSPDSSAREGTTTAEPQSEAESVPEAEPAPRSEPGPERSTGGISTPATNSTEAVTPSNGTARRLRDRVLLATFDDSGQGRYTQQEAKRDFEDNGGRLEGFSLRRGTLRVVDDPTGQGRALALTQPAGTVGQAPTWHVDFPTSYESAQLRYRVWFGEGFEFDRKGGKLPGLGARAPGAPDLPACTSRTGRREATARVMWHLDGRGGAYTYHPEEDGPCGDNDRFFVGWQDERWYDLRLRWELNTPGRSDGRLTIWIDGDRLYQDDNYLWRERLDGEAAFGINQFRMGVFFGGKADNGFEHSRDETILIDDISLVVGGETALAERSQGERRETS